MIPTADRTKWVPLAISATYALVSAAWIFFSDRMLATVVGTFPAYQAIQTYKGWAFITVSALVLYGALRYAWSQLEKAHALLDLSSDLARLGGWRSDLATGKIEATRGTYAAYAMEDVPMDSDTILSCYAPADREILLSERQRVVRDRQESAGEFAITALDGTEKWLRVMQRPQIGMDGKVSAVVGAVQDISEIVALRREAEMLAGRVRNMVENMPDAFMLLDRDMRFTYGNPKAAEIVALAQQPGAEYIGKTLWEVFPLVASQLGVPMAQLMSNGEPVNFVLEVPTTRAIRRVAAFMTPDGIGMHVRDVTEEVRAQNKLRDSVERFRLASLASQDVLFDWDAVEDRMVASDAVRQRYGYDPAVFPKTMGEFLTMIHPEDRQRITASVATSMQPGQPENWSERYRALTSDGKVVHVLERALTLRDGTGKPVRVVGTITDVTASYEEERRLRAIIDVAADAIYEYDPKRQTMTYSKGILTNFGNDWVGEKPVPTPWQDKAHPEDRDRALAAFEAFCNGTDLHFRIEYRMARGDGQYANVREKALAVRDETGALIRVFGSMEDVTSERRAEERMKHAERIQAIGTLTGGVAHDFNNLLTIILGNAELLEIDGGLNAPNRKLAAAILKAAERGAQLTASLLAFSGKQPLAPKPVDGRAALAEMARLLERTLPANIRLQINAAPDIWMFEADPAQLSAAILNLVVNARDAMPDGGSLRIDCTNETSNGTEAEAEVEAGEFVRIAVTDTGTGMAPEVLAHVFEPFFTTKPRGTGTGLGLSMVHGFVKQSGGHMRIVSAPGEGTVVSVYLPRSRFARAEVETDLTVPILVGHGEHVLVVEDNAFLLPHVTEMVAGLGYRVSAAADAQAALDILRDTDDVDVLFTDVVLPGPMNGPALAKIALAARPGLCVLFTSGYTENATIHHGRTDRDVHLLAKPYRRNELARKLRQVITEHSRPEAGPDARQSPFDGVPS